MFLTLKLITTVYDLLTLPIYFFIEKPWLVKRHSKTYYADRHYELNGDYTYWECKPEFTSFSGKSGNPLESKLDNFKHLSELVPIALEFYSSKPCLGSRKVLRKVVEKGKNKYELSDYEWLTYAQTKLKIDNLTKVLHHKFQFKRGDRVALMFNTIEEWFITFFCISKFRL